jgi:hypothetical protein
MTLIDQQGCDGEFGTTSAEGQVAVTVTPIRDTQAAGDRTIILDTLTCQVTGSDLPLSECDARLP